MLLVIVAVPHVAGTVPATQQALRQFTSYDQKLTSVGYRLAVSTRGFCKKQAPLIGLAFHDIAQYAPSEQPDARSTFAFDGHILVLAVATDSPAAKAGIQVDDAVVLINGQAVPPAVAGVSASFARTAAFLDQLEAALAAADQVSITIERAGQRREIAVKGEMGCPTRFQTRASATIFSQADGTNVEVSSGLMDFAQSDDELAGVIAHELSHNILGHRTSLDRQRIHRGLLGQFGRSARLVRDTEQQADRLSVYLLARAGYSPDGSLLFFKHYQDSHPLNFLGAPTHPAFKSRIAILQAEIARLNAMTAQGLIPYPEFLTAPPRDRLHQPPAITASQNP
ncbi:M48 family metalloprotease [Sphingomonas sp. ASY06-1R]|uniref:M48 family metallopeptidase n=1 Tax=Sphingomonas sp. ASY06-1R TaxID=3445771 RepID=UPI003FA24A04